MNEVAITRASVATDFIIIWVVLYYSVGGFGGRKKRLWCGFGLVWLGLGGWFSNNCLLLLFFCGWDLASWRECEVNFTTHAEWYILYIHIVKGASLRSHDPHDQRHLKQHQQ